MRDSSLPVNSWHHSSRDSHHCHLCEHSLLVILRYQIPEIKASANIPVSLVNDSYQGEISKSVVSLTSIAPSDSLFPWPISNHFLSNCSRFSQTDFPLEKAKKSRKIIHAGIQCSYFNCSSRTFSSLSLLLNTVRFLSLSWESI